MKQSNKPTVPCFNCTGTMHAYYPDSDIEKDACKCFHSNMIYVCDTCGVKAFHCRPAEETQRENPK